MKNIILIGAGGIGRRHIKAYLATNRATISIVEPDNDKVSSIKNDFKISKAFNKIEDVQLSDFDLALICSPANFHVEPMKICALNKLPFMVEKPLSTSMEGVDEVITLVKKNNLFARVGYTRRNSEHHRSLREKILNHKIGDVKLIYINSSQEFPKYRPDYQKIYYAHPHMGGGAILDAATHLIDQLIWIIGKPSEVSCMFDRLVLEGTNTEDTCLINIRFENGSMANIMVNQFQKPNINSFEFIGTKGNLRLNHSNLKFSDDDSGIWKEEKDYCAGLNPMEVHQNNFLLQANRILDGLEGQECDLATLEEARLNLEVVFAAKKSWQEKKIIKIN
ncbi:MAG: Gfo/Idh/MocA family oxidoreductase [Pelagibacteraceae bacterium]|nr:Gfo/Idh/MocA family oxidoreductase [Pelagibacteraceae bacterium]